MSIKHLSTSFAPVNKKITKMLAVGQFAVHRAAKRGQQDECCHDRCHSAVCYVNIHLLIIMRTFHLVFNDIDLQK